MKKQTLLAALCCGLLLTGCASIVHERDIIADGKVVGHETEKASGFFSKAAVENVATTTKDGNYSHSFRAKGASVSGDSETITASGSALGNLIGAAAAATAKSTVKP